MAATNRNTRTSPPPRPLMPRLPTTTTALRSSPAPRLAAPVSKSSPSSTTSSNAPLWAQQKVDSPRIPGQEAAATPVKGVGFNVTPRSSARKAKVSSVNTTPTQPSVDPDRAFSPTLYKSSRLAATIDIASPRPVLSEKTAPEVERGSVTRGTFPPISRSSVSPTALSLSQPPHLSDYGPSFFHAGDRPLQEQPQRPVLQKKTSSFMYADGRRESGFAITTQPRASNTRSCIQETDQKSQTSRQPNGDDDDKFLHAGMPKPTKPSSITSSANGTASPGGFAAIAPRSPSPTKFDFHLSYRKGASQIIRPPISNNTSLSTISSEDSKRRQSSLDTTSDPLDATRRTSTTSFSSSTPKRSSTSDPRPHTQNRNSCTTTPLVTYLEDQSDPANPTPIPQTSDEQPPPITAIPTPSEPPSDALDPTTRARHERKVLDLEISNSSLLAINRSLEREMRKQKLELCRFRRLTRNNARTSWLSDGSSAGGSVGGLPSLDELAGMGLEEEGELRALGFLGGYTNGLLSRRGNGDGDEGTEDDEGSEVASTTRSASDGAMSPSTLAAADARDQKRLKCDLARHRELLVDSQRMNVCLKRCLGITEMLMKEGARALETKVEVRDLKFGGRVLSPEEVDGFDDEGREHDPAESNVYDGEELVGANGVYHGALDERYNPRDSVLRKEAFEYFDSDSGVREAQRRDSLQALNPHTSWLGIDGDGHGQRVTSSTLSDEMC